MPLPKIQWKKSSTNVRTWIKARQSTLIGIAATIFIVGISISIHNLGLAIEDLSVVPLLLNLFFGAPIAIILSSLGLQLSARTVSQRIDLMTALPITSMAAMADLLPLPGSALVRGAALVTGGASVRESTGVIVVTGVLSIAVAAALAGGALYDDWRVLAVIIFAISISLSVVCIFWIARLGGVGLAIRFVVHRVVTLAVLVARIWLAFAAIGVYLNPLDTAVFAVAGVLGSAVSLAPSGLGISEMLAAALAGLIAVSPAAAFTAMGINRILGLIAVGVFILALGPKLAKSSSK